MSRRRQRRHRWSSTVSGATPQRTAADSAASTGAATPPRLGQHAVDGESGTSSPLRAHHHRRQRRACRLLCLRRPALSLVRRCPSRDLRAPLRHLQARCGRPRRQIHHFLVQDRCRRRLLRSRSQKGHLRRSRRRRRRRRCLQGPPHHLRQETTIAPGLCPGTTVGKWDAPLVSGPGRLRAESTGRSIGAGVQQRAAAESGQGVRAGFAEAHTSSSTSSSTPLLSLLLSLLPSLSLSSSCTRATARFCEQPACTAADGKRAQGCRTMGLVGSSLPASLMATYRNRPSQVRSGSCSGF